MRTVNFPKSTVCTRSLPGGPQWAKPKTGSSVRFLRVSCASSSVLFVSLPCHLTAKSLTSLILNPSPLVIIQERTIGISCLIRVHSYWWPMTTDCMFVSWPTHGHLPLSCLHFPPWKLHPVNGQPLSSSYFLHSKGRKQSKTGNTQFS